MSHAAGLLPCAQDDALPNAGCKHSTEHQECEQANAKRSKQMKDINDAYKETLDEQILLQATIQGHIKKAQDLCFQLLRRSCSSKRPKSCRRDRIVCFH